MTRLLDLIYPELILAAVACVLMLLGVVARPGARRLSAIITILTLLILFSIQAPHQPGGAVPAFDSSNSIRLNEFGSYIRMLTAGMGVLLALLAWPSDPDATGN